MLNRETLKKVTSRFLPFLLAFVLFAAGALTGCSGSSGSETTGTAQTTAASYETEAETDPETESAAFETSEEIGETTAEESSAEENGPPVTEDGEYSSKEEVAAYINEFGHLPSNYITKSEAQDLGWVSSKGNLWDVAPGKSIGGDKFGNYEGLLPKADGRKYYECDIDFNGGTRNAKRIIYSNDGLIYYTEDHYESFELLYGDE